MKRVAIVSLLGIMIISGCNDHANKNVSSDWGVHYSTKDNAAHALGSLDKQNSGPKVTYIVDTAYLRHLKQAYTYQVMYKFTTPDSLQLVLVKVTSDYNYHYPKPGTENQLLYAIFNRDTLDLKESALSVQPRSDGGSFTTVINLHTNNAGDFNGTIDKVVLIQK